MGRLTHGLEIYARACRALDQTGTVIHDRLARAVQHLSALHDDEISPIILPRHQSLMNEMTQIASVSDEGSITATINSLSDTAAKEKCKTIIAIYGAIKAEHAKA